MATEATHEADTGAEIAELERKVAELRMARAQMIVERDEHARSGARTAALLDGLAQIHRELGVLAKAKLASRDRAEAARAAAASDVARLAAAHEEAERDARDAGARLSVARETEARVARERTAATLAANEAALAVERLASEYDETARAAADVTLKYDAALAENAIVEGRDVQFTDIEETLDRESLLAETRLREARTRAETVRVEADLERVRDLEDRLGAERADLERRLRGMRSTVDDADRERTPAQQREVKPAGAAGPEAGRITLAARLARDLVNPGTDA